MSDNDPIETGTHIDTGDDQISVDSTRGSLTNLQQNFSQQQAKITALKELVRQSEEDHGKNTASAQEKAKNIAQRLTHLKSKTSRSRQTSEKSFTEIREEISIESCSSGSMSMIETESVDRSVVTPIQRRRSEAPGSEKIQLLRQQMEQNRLRMAERESNKRGIEEMVTQLKAKFNSSQQSLDRSHLLGNSIGDLSALSTKSLKHQSVGDLSGGFNLERERIKYLEKRIKHLENEMKQKEHEFLHRDPDSEQSKMIQQLNARILDLEENLKEKDGLIDAKTKAANLISESLSLKGKDTVDLLEETKQEMVKMQENFVANEDELNKRIAALEKEIQSKDKRIANLEEVNDILETARFDLTLKNSELDSKTGSVEDYANKLNELNKINETLQHRIESLENEKEESATTTMATTSTEEIDVSEYVHQIQQLETRIATLESENDDLKKSLQSALNTPASDASDQERINNLEATISAQKEDGERLSNLLQTTQDQLMEKTVEYNVLMANFNVLDEKLKSYGPKSIFSKSTDEEAQAEINKLTKQLDDANKTGIKTKLKMKQLQKQIDTFKKTSDTNKELVKLMDENQRLGEKLKELETEIASLKSQCLESAAEDGDGDHNKSTQELEAKIKVLETTCQNQTSAIQLLEEQKLDMTADLNETKTELTSLKGHIKDKDKQDVTSEMDSIANEERIESLLKEIDALNGQINRLVAEKKDLKSKLDRYISENMELLEKIDKLSKGSSVESIEILERLTQEEKLEMDRLQQAAETNIIERQENCDHTDDISNAPQSDCHESINDNADDSQKKLESLLEENRQFSQTIDDLRAEKVRILEELDKSKAANLSTLKEMSEIQGECDKLAVTIKEVEEVKLKLENDIIQLTKERDSALASSKSKKQDEPLVDSSTYATGLKNLCSELDNYRSAKEKNAKVAASKKLARESKNMAELMEKLLLSYNSSVEELETFKAEVEGERTSRAELEKSQLCASDKEEEIKELKQQIDELRENKENLKSKCDDLEQQVETQESSHNNLEKSVAELKSENDRLNEQIKSLQMDLDDAKESDFQELQKQRKEFDNLLESNKKELEILRDLVNEQKQQLITAYTEHEVEQNQKEAQIASYTEQIEKLQQELRDAQSQMQNANASYADELNEKITTLQSLLDENKQLIEQQTADLDHKQSTIESLNQQIMDLYKSMESHTVELAERDDEIELLQSQIDKNKADIKKMNQNNLASERKAKELDSALKRKETEWQKELTEKMNEWDKQRQELETKNKEQLEKLKKFAANLKKRNAQYIELEQKFNALSKESQVEQVIVPQQVQQVESVPLQQTSNDSELREKISHLEQELHESLANTVTLRDDIDRKVAEVENLKLCLSEKTHLFDELCANLNAKQNEIAELQGKLVELQAVKEELTKTADDLKAKNIKIEKCKAIIKEKNKEIKRLQELEQAMLNKESSEVSANELKLQLDQAQSEKDKINEDFENYRSFIETKLQNSDLVVESIETENAQLKDRIARLEESICKAEERRSSLERHSELLGSQLKEKQSQIENAEDEYAERLRTLVGQDEIIEKKLQDMESERDGLLETLKDYENQMNEWSGKNEELEQRIYELESTKLVELEEENKELSSRIEKIESELTRKQHEFDQKITEKQTELSELENELSNHLQSIERDRRSMQENLEKSIEENALLQDQIVQLRESQSSLELSRNELEKEMTWVKMQNDTMTQDQLEAQELRMQVVQDQTEVDNLHAQNLELVEKHTSELNLLQIQLTEAAEARTVAEAEVERINSMLATVRDDSIRELDTLKTQICEDQTEIVNLRLRNDQMVTDHENEIANLHSRITELSASYEHLQRDASEVESLRMHKQQLETEITLLRQQISALDALQMNVGQNITQDQMEVQQLRLQIAHDQTEIETLRHQIQQLHANHESELAALRQQIAELDSLRMQVGQNQTDDQVFIQNENERLQSLLAEKEIEIQNYQRQNLQLQMSAGGISNDPFSSFTNTTSDMNDVMTLNSKVSELETRLENTLHEIADSKARYTELQRLCMEKDSEIARLQERNHNVSSGSESIANEPIMVSHQTQALNVSPFEIQAPIEPAANPNISSSGNHGQQIEDLQRNVSDLEKYVTDLEHKLKAANEEIMKHHVERTNFDKILSTKAKQYEDELTTLNSSLAELRAQLVSVQETNTATEQVSIPTHQVSQLPSAASFFFSPNDDNPFASITSNFQETGEPDYSGQLPVVEEAIVPKKAYVCGPEEQRTLSPMNDDWGESAWGNDAILEEQHQQQSISTNQAVLNQAAINLQIQIDEIRNERDNISSELSSLQVKYQKLLKKLKEYKVKIDEHQHSKIQSKPSFVESNDLDLAIQEELNGQIKALEQKLKETKAEQEKDVVEKKKLLSRIDVLTAANDRMTEMKDKQDIEIEVCKTKIRELNGRLEKLNEWGDEGGAKPGMQDEIAARLTESQNQNRLLEERIQRLQAAADKDEFEDERDQYFDQLRVLTAEKVLLEENITIKTNEIDKLHEKMVALERQNNDFKATIEILSEESNNIKLHLDQLKDEHKQKIDENTSLSEKLTELVEKNAALAKQVEEMRVYNLNSHDTEQRIQDLTASIQYKDSEISAFNEKLENQKKTFDQEYERLNKELSNNANTIAELRQQIARVMAENENLLKNQAPVTPPLESTSTVDIQKLQQVVNELREEKANMEAELQVLNDQVIKNLEIEDRIKSTVLELDMKNIEIAELKNSLQQIKETQHNASPDPNQQHQITELVGKLQEKDLLHQSNVDLLNAQWQQIVDQKCAEVADSWRQHLQIKEDEFAAVGSDLREKLLQIEQQSNTTSSTTSETQNTPTSGESRSVIPELPESDDANADQSELIKTMQNALEQQEIEIVSLKEQLAIRSAEYARIAASVDPYAMKSTSSNFFPSVSQTEEQPSKGNELDLALYMLHQRDMRCEELTEEVIHLLDERDTLQLKLSNSIRQFEEFKQKAGADGVDSLESSTSPVKSNPASSDAHSSHDGSFNEPSQSDNLDLKLSELHKVSQSRDKTLKEEREQRRRQMNIFQKDMANMPPEAMAELFGPDFKPNTRNTQNTSSTLMDWILGRGDNEPYN
ncbi:protein lava lamp [Contarinia nasturtii]|uniref:protein lava lamp n=1 Tax=Contarinia nasturtii TaxID=265458 RepID=UPI0012D399C8|nr:protein lava lamp [Contarinia nasturtii]XP_031624927.1 protein lava lamp [Contarinia nasturtii]XP_031624928.1 protein lava lamp [Contarinia nasturtii]XP_031624929.1 protein lava lamp [Contarinia nasturtii]